MSTPTITPAGAASDATAAKFFLAPSIGGGFFIIPEFAVALYGTFVSIFFDNYAYIGISPGLRVELKL